MLSLTVRPPRFPDRVWKVSLDVAKYYSLKEEFIIKRSIYICTHNDNKVYIIYLPFANVACTRRQVPTHINKFGENILYKDQQGLRFILRVASLYKVVSMKTIDDVLSDGVCICGDTQKVNILFSRAVKYCVFD